MSRWTMKMMLRTVAAGMHDRRSCGTIQRESKWGLSGNMRAVSIDVQKSGIRIKMVAEEKGYRPKQIQTALKLASVQAVYQWYEGRKFPTPDNLLLLARLFKVPMDSLVVGIDDDLWTDDRAGERVEEIYRWSVNASRDTKYMRDRYEYFSEDGVLYLLPTEISLE